MKHFALISLFVAAPLFASADMTETIKCSGSLNSGMYAEFTMTSTIVPTFFRAELAIDHREYTMDMNCKTFAGDIEVTECVEKIPGGNRYKVTLAAGKAYVSQEGSNPGFNDIEKGALICE